MKYLKFHIKNFKGIEDLTLDLNASPKLKAFTLVGLNESGKTTILEAIDLLQNPISKEKSHTLIPKHKKINFNEKVEVNADLLVDDEDSKRIKQFAQEKYSFRLENLISKFSITRYYKFQNSKYIEDKRLWGLDLIGKKKGWHKARPLDDSSEEWHAIVNFISENLLPPIIYYANFLFEFPEKIYVERYEDEDEKQSFYRHVIQDVLDSLNKELALEKHIAKRMKSQDEEDKESLTSTLNQVSSVITEKVFKSWQDLFKKSSRKREVIVLPKSEMAIKKDGISEERYFLEIKIKEGADPFNIAERSLGFRWFFVFLLFTEFRKYRSDDRGEILFLLDEPASNLHSTAQRKLVEALQSLVDKSKLIYTTHSHYLINPEWLEGAFIVQNEALDYDQDLDYTSQVTKIKVDPYRIFVAKSPNQQTYFQPILDQLDYKPSDLEFVPEIVIVEGKNDFYTFKYIQDVILRLKKDDCLNFYPGNGAGKNEQVIRLYIAWGRKFLVLMDSDPAGVDAKEKYIENQGKLIEDKIFDLSDTTKGLRNKTTEDLFTDTEKLKIIKALDPQVKIYSKVKFNNSIQHLLFLKERIELSEGSKNRFKIVLNFLRGQFKK